MFDKICNVIFAVLVFGLIFWATMAFLEATKGPVDAIDPVLDDYTADIMDTFEVTNDGEVFAPTHSMVDSTMLITVKEYENLGDLNRAYVLDSCGPIDCTGITFPEVEGYSTYNTQQWPFVCTIHVLRPTIVNGRNVSTLGHELSHCVHGAYHNED